MKPFDMINIGMAAATLNDVEGARKAAFNRLGTLQRSVDQMGFGLPDDHPAVIAQTGQYEAVLTLEKSVIKALEKAVKANPLGPWVMAQKGVGLKQAGRLLGSIGDPYWHSGYYDTGAVDKAGEPVMKAYDRPRTVSELWSYCGVGDAGRQVRRKGQQDNWNADAKMRLWNISGACLKAQGHYADIYYATREHYADALHAAECKRCGPSGKPARAGSPLSLGHQHARALRKVGKQILKDLWRESKRLHEEMELPQAA